MMNSKEMMKTILLVDSMAMMNSRGMMVMTLWMVV